MSLVEIDIFAYMWLIVI